MRRGIFILVTCMALLLTSCNKGVSEEVKDGILPQELINVILNDAVFISTEQNDKETRLSEFDFYNGEILDGTVELGRYAVVDLDGDGYREVILEVFSDMPEPQLEVLRWEDTKVYGYQFPYRAMLKISADGVIEGSSGAAYNDTYRLSFSKSDYKETILAKDRDDKFYIGEETVEWTEYNNFISETFKIQVEWLDDYSKLK